MARMLILPNIKFYIFDMNKNFSIEPVYTISTAARLLGVSVPTLRMYEREGLLIPFKSTGNQRRYSDMDLERIRCIRRAINEDKIGIEGIRRMLALIPCWAVMSCTAEDYINCEAFQSYSKPCWTFNHKINLCSGRDCRQCDVYNSFTDCASIKEKLKELVPPIK
ncbi:putative heat shock protein HspR [bacterium BMS3Abin03]|nr:putative heat shock protein HspR [bacterium BMS3Abin03]